MRIPAVLLGAFALSGLCRADILYTFTVTGPGWWSDTPAPATFTLQTPTFIDMPLAVGQPGPAGLTTCSPGSFPGVTGCAYGAFVPNDANQSQYADASIFLDTAGAPMNLRAAFPIADFEQFGRFESVDVGYTTVRGTMTVTTTPEPASWGLLSIAFAGGLLFWCKSLGPHSRTLRQRG